MRKINQEFSEDFKSLCLRARTSPQCLEAKTYKKKQNRKLFLELKQDGTFNVFLSYHNHKVATFYARDNTLVLDSQGHGTSPSTKGLLNSLCPQGYGYFSRDFEGYIQTPEGVKDFDTLLIKPYI
jgi:hypothetical protein